MDTIYLVEQLYVIMMNRGHSIVGIFNASSGGITGTIMDPRIIYCVALNCLATKIIIAHNHPSGNLKPSRQDELMTQRIKDAGKLLEIELLDHLIIMPEGYYSFADEGMI